MINYSLLSILATIICLTGTYYNVQKDKWCFNLWVIGNLMWIVFDMRYGWTSRVLLDCVQLYFAVVGLVEWSKTDNKDDKGNKEKKL